MANKSASKSLFTLLIPAWIAAWIYGVILSTARSFFFSLLSKIVHGQMIVKTARGETFTIGKETTNLRVTIAIKNELSFYWRLFTQWDIGVAEAYMFEDIDIDDLTKFVYLMIKNRSLSDQATGLAKVGAFVHRLEHLSRHNNIDNARKNIHAHYDLSNEMFKSFLDPSMMYSCAVFTSKDETLEQAQKNKIHKIIRDAGITSKDHVLEIGSGWGGFAIECAKQTGCKITTLTISEEQYAEAKERIARAGLQDKIDLRLCDYRKITGKFSKVVSIEMVEAVGHEYLPEYFATIDRLLAEDGVAVIQAITYPDGRYADYRQGCDFIQKHVFPGSLCPSVTAMCDAMARDSQLQLERLDNIGVDYAETLRRWRKNFIAASPRLRSLGFPESFLRTWLYYFCYCEAGFESKVLGTVHLQITRPGNESLKSPLQKSVCAW